MMGWIMVLLSALPYPGVPGLRQHAGAHLERNLAMEREVLGDYFKDPAHWKEVNARRVVLRLKTGLDETHPALSRLFKRFGVLRVVGRSHYPDRMNFLTVELPESSMSLSRAFLDAATSISEVLYAEPEVHYTLSGCASGCTPNDPLFWDPNANAYQWGFVSVGADSAWCTLTGNSAVGVAVLDAGILYTHPDIQGNYVGGYDFIDNDADPYPADGENHGTHVGGTIAAVLNNGLGVAGFGNFSLYSLRVCTVQGCSSTALANALLSVAYTPGIHVANMSLGSGTHSQIVQDAADTAYYNYGKLLVAATGNEGNPFVDFPAAYASVIAVTAYAWDGGFAGNYYYQPAYASYGAGVGLNPAPYGIELIAPGGDVSSYAWYLGILSTGFDSTMTPNYLYMDGTSMAAPHVSGLAALVLARAFANGVSLPVTTLRSILDDNTGDQGIWIPVLGDWDPAGYDIYTGFGNIVAYWAIHDPRVGVSVEETAGAAEPFLMLRWDPAHQVLHIRRSERDPSPIRLTMLDPAGRRLLTRTLAPLSRATVPLPGPAGLYFVRVETGEMQRTLRLIRP